MPKVPRGEMSLDEIRSLVRQHNKLYTIKGVDTKSRAQLLKDIDAMGYKIDHAAKKIHKVPDVVREMKQGPDGKMVGGRVGVRQGAVLKLGVGEGKGERKPQEKTVAKARRKEFAKEATKDVDKRTGRPLATVSGKEQSDLSLRLMNRYGGHSIKALDEHLEKIGKGLSAGGGSKAKKLLKISKHKGLKGLPVNKPKAPPRPAAAAAPKAPKLPPRPVALAKEKARKELVAKGRRDLIAGRYKIGPY